MAKSAARKEARERSTRGRARPQKSVRAKSVPPKYVYSFGNGKADGSSALRDLLGGKGCELAEMTTLGIPVPPGFTITTEAWAGYVAAGKKHPPGLWTQVGKGLAQLERASGLAFGDSSRPLLVSVRSGARVSMPGMMDTVLNLGLNDRTVTGLARWTKNERFAWDCYRRFIMLFADVVLRHRSAPVRGAARRGQEPDRRRARTPRCRRPPSSSSCGEFKRLVADRTGRPFPQDPMDQLALAINAVFDSWFAKKAVDYRRINRLADDWGTAVTVMAMVFGNLGRHLGHRRVLQPRPVERRGPASSASSS